MDALGMMKDTLSAARELKAKYDQRRKQKRYIEQWDLDDYPDISEFQTSRALKVAGITHHKKEIKRVCKFLGFKPSAKDQRRAITVILRQEDNKRATGGVAVGVWYYGLHLGYVAESDLRRVKQRMTKLSDGKDVKADARLIHFDKADAPINVWISFDA
ncbi:hypothetical protein QEV60_09145 [Trueperella pyogenes]|uniref:hypothetical protein n=1 Tax=Trueperella pyogenes TaxID=1661 RepID=UPI003132F019